GLRERYEVHHGVRIEDAALVAAARLSHRYISTRFLPDKAIDLVDEAGSRLRIQIDSMPEPLEKVERRIMHLTIEQTALKKEKDTPEDSAEVVAKWTGIPLAKLMEGERERLLRLEDELARRVVGQREAVEVVANAVRRSRSGLQDPNRPIGSFLFLGPTGVG